MAPICEQIDSVFNQEAFDIQNVYRAEKSKCV